MHLLPLFYHPRILPQPRPSSMPIPCDAKPVLHHSGLKTTLYGVHHQASTPEWPIHQYRGIKYASIPARFRQSLLLTALPPKTDASCYGCARYSFGVYTSNNEQTIRPICPQLRKKCFEEELFGLGRADVPQQILEQNELECLNLNITCPSGLTAQSRLPVMLWVHGCVYTVGSATRLLTGSFFLGGAIEVTALVGYMTRALSSGTVW